MIIRAGELGREMFFIKAGAVQVCFLVSWIYRPTGQITYNFASHSSALLASHSNNATNMP